MRFTNGKRKCTLTLKNGSLVFLSKDAEKLVSKLPPPYVLKDPAKARNNNIPTIPRTDPNEHSCSFFLVLDISVKVSEELEDLDLR